MLLVAGGRLTLVPLVHLLDVNVGLLEHLLQKQHLFLKLLYLLLLLVANHFRLYLLPNVLPAYPQIVIPTKIVDDCILV